ncbi:MAG: major facilitator superfamily domain-containing protein [Linnemannia elongata]|nr:MAG: major facilitator superfamily domain-containing protein [Linnemannia elongata]
MQPGANGNAVNLSASSPCDADHASSPINTSNNDKYELESTTYNDKYELDSTSPSAAVAATLNYKQELSETDSLEKGNAIPIRPDQLILNQAPLLDVGKKPFLYGLRTHKHYITLTILLALFTDMVSYGIIIPIMPSIIEHMGGDSTKTGVLVAVYAAGIMSASPIFGMISDKMASRRLPMMIGLTGLLTSTIIFMFAKVYWLLIIARFFQGVSGGAVWTLGLALMTDSFPASEMGIQMGKSLIGHTMGMLGGPPIGGLLHDAYGERAPFYFCIAFILMVMTALGCLIEVRADEALELREFDAELRERARAKGIEYKVPLKTSLWQIITTKRMIAAVTVTTLEAFDLSSLEPTLPFYLRDRFGMSEGQIGLVFIAFTMPTIVSPLAGWVSDRYGAKILCCTAVIICACFMLVLSIENKPLWGIVLNLVGIGLATSSFIAPILGEISAVVRRTGDSAAYARAFAIFNMAFSFGMLIGPIIAGYIYQHHGFKWNCITTACILFFFVPIMIMWMGDRKQKMEDIAMYEREEEERQMMLADVKLIKAERRAAEELNAATLCQPAF